MTDLMAAGVRPVARARLIPLLLPLPPGPHRRPLGHPPGRTAGRLPP